MSTFYVLVAPLVGGHPIVVAVRSDPPITGTSVGSKWYRITAETRDQAKQFAKDRWYAGDQADAVYQA